MMIKICDDQYVNLNNIKSIEIFPVEDEDMRGVKHVVAGVYVIQFNYEDGSIIWSKMRYDMDSARACVDGWCNAYSKSILPVPQGETTNG